MGKMGDWWNPFGDYVKPTFSVVVEEEEPKTLWQRIVGRVFSNRPTYVIVNDVGSYFCGHRTLWGSDYDGEYYPCGRQEVWSTEPEKAVVYETLKGAQRRLKRIDPFVRAAIVAAIREQEEQVIECEEWLEPMSPTAAISTGASMETITQTSAPSSTGT